MTKCLGNFQFLLHIRVITSGFQLSPVSLLRAFELRGLCFTLEISVEIPWGVEGSTEWAKDIFREGPNSKKQLHHLGKSHSIHGIFYPHENIQINLNVGVYTIHGSYMGMDFLFISHIGCYSCVLVRISTYFWFFASQLLVGVVRYGKYSVWDTGL